MLESVVGIIGNSRTPVATFIETEEGAITVDWVVITAAVVGLVISVFAWIGNDTADYGERIGSYMQTQGVKTTY